MGAYNHVVHEFEPVLDECSRILILGSFPSVLSRVNDFYYGNPQNRFWKVMAAYLGADVPKTVPDKIKLLLGNGIALWDVVAECDIEGSSDASISNVVPVDIGRVLEVAPIRHVVCNGGTAGRLYARYLEEHVGIPAVTLPSTSSANAAWTLARLEGRWWEVLGGME